MKQNLRFQLVSFLSLLSLSLLVSCDKGEVKKASGNYEATVVNPQGHSDVGNASVTNSGDFFSIVINSDVGNFSITGTLVDSEIDTTFTDSAGETATAFFEFSVDRSTFTGNIQTTTGLFVVRGTHL
ncbi:MAG: hypothetical protein HYS08_07995 [Chlamydiae bacterium]|nr:hypothetical protein [Chlamydiota bacterium]MBI3266067.1 hypothetical protein [Chlamydiota bacterium]